MKCTPKVGQKKFNFRRCIFNVQIHRGIEKGNSTLEHKIKHYGVRVLQRKYGIPRSLIRQWIAQYELNGKFTEPTRHFSGEFKLKVLNYQQEHNLSNLATALIFGITNQGNQGKNGQKMKNLHIFGWRMNT